jgi:hypothetical protein
MSAYVLNNASDGGQLSTGPALSTVKPRRKEVLTGEDTTIYTNCIDNIADHDRISFLQVESPMDGVYYIDGVLSPHECTALRQRIEDSKDLSFWCAGKECDDDIRSFRNAFTIELFTHEFADRIWRRVKHLLSENIIVDIPDDPDNDDFERELVGIWEPSGMNPDNLLVRYPSFGSFAPHTDGRAVIDFNHRSHYSALIFFNTVPIEMGAGTRFYDKSAVAKLEKKTINNVEYWTADPSLITAAVGAVEGRLLIFHQALVHEGIPPIEPYMKYILRSDVIFARNPPICDGIQDREAYRLFKQAEDLAENGEVDAAVPLFKKAFKLSPEMARIMGQG